MFTEAQAAYKIVKLCFYKHSICDSNKLNILISELALFHLKYMTSTKQLFIADFFGQK
jgi:hypothetical protein